MKIFFALFKHPKSIIFPKFLVHTNLIFGVAGQVLLLRGVGRMDGVHIHGRWTRLLWPVELLLLREAQVLGAYWKLDSWSTVTLIMLAKARGSIPYVQLRVFGAHRCHARPRKVLTLDCGWVVHRGLHVSHSAALCARGKLGLLHMYLGWLFVHRKIILSGRHR